VLGCPVGFLDLSMPDHGYHAPNENFEWAQAAGGMAAFARLAVEWSELARAKPPATEGHKGHKGAQRTAKRGSPSTR
jgi:hypothetical protein